LALVVVDVALLGWGTARAEREQDDRGGRNGSVATHLDPHGIIRNLESRRKAARGSASSYRAESARATQRVGPARERSRPFPTAYTSFDSTVRPGASPTWGKRSCLVSSTTRRWM